MTHAFWDRVIEISYYLDAAWLALSLAVRIAAGRFPILRMGKAKAAVFAAPPFLWESTAVAGYVLSGDRAGVGLIHNHAYASQSCDVRWAECKPREFLHSDG